MGKCETRYSSDTSDCEKMGAYNASLSTTGVFIAKDDFDEGLDLDGDVTWATWHIYADDVTIAGQGEPSIKPCDVLADTAQARSTTKRLARTNPPRPISMALWG